MKSCILNPPNVIYVRAYIMRKCQNIISSFCVPENVRTVIKRESYGPDPFKKKKKKIEKSWKFRPSPDSMYIHFLSKFILIRTVSFPFFDIRMLAADLNYWVENFSAHPLFSSFRSPFILSFSHCRPGFLRIWTFADFFFPQQTAKIKVVH